MSDVTEDNEVPNSAQPKKVVEPFQPLTGNPENHDYMDYINYLKEKKSLGQSDTSE